MYRIIGGDGREYGPVTGDAVRQWILQNRANSKTLVKADDSSDWRPLGDIPEFAGSFGAPPPQRAAAPAAPPPIAVPKLDPMALKAALEARDYDLNIGDCLGSAWRMLMANFWLIVGGAFLVLVCATAISMVPIAGLIASLVLSQVFYGGLYYFYIKLSRGEPTSIGDAFSGFSRSFGQLVLLSIVYNILISIVVIPVVLPAIGMALWAWQPVVMVPLMMVFAIPAIYLSIGWLFASMLVIDRGLEFWDAMELSRKVVSRHWFKVLWFAIVVVVVGISGMLVLFVGMLVTLPLFFASMAHAYETLFPRDGHGEAKDDALRPN